MKKFNVLYDEDNCAMIPNSFVDYETGSIITTNEKMINIISICLKVAKSEAPILITGESGVGKELLSELIHNNSNRKNEPFVKVNCAAIPDNLKESEFFGYEPGSFTGASRFGKKGLIEMSQNGTLFLDEIGEMPLNLQSILLRVLQDGRFVKVGGYKEIKSDVRIICASNTDLKTMVDEGLFRNDLYFRLNVIPITIPPLSSRKDDIPLLALYFTDYFNRQYNTNKKLSRDVINALVNLTWSGNIRELRNTIERLILISLDDIISPDNLYYVESISNKENYLYYNTRDIAEFEGDSSLKKAMEDYELIIIRKAVDKYGSIRKAAKALDTTPSTISRKLSKNKPSASI
ncbi:MAG: sigma 54-interacting transcriptional regulator [Eubacteriales bacterium]|nr:sigma 54-interacting transcriptional regulator [Eubacteriales bacterium]